MNRVILLSGRSAVEAFRMRAASSRDAAAFGATVSTPSSWLSELWSVWGDGRSIASDGQRFLAFMQALEEQDDLPVSSGVASLLVRLADGGLGTWQLDEALSGKRNMSPAHQPLLSILRAYEQALGSAGLVDAGRAWGVLARIGISFPRCVVECRGFEPSAALREFCERRDEVDAHFEDGSACIIGAASEGVQVRFAFPSGRYAEPFLLAQALQEMASEGLVVVTTKNPLSLYEAISSACLRAGISCAAQGRVRFFETDFGRACACVRDIVYGEGVARTAATDYLMNPFSGASPDAAHDFDAWVRSNRLIEKDVCVARLRELSGVFEYFEELALSPDAAVVTGVFEDRVRGMRGVSEAYASEQLSAIACFRSAAEDARLLGAETGALFALLERASVDASRACGEGNPQVLIMGQGQAALRASRSCAGVIMCDMDSGSYPLRSRDDAARSLLRAAGVADAPSPLAEARRTFAAIAALPTRQFVIERRLHDEDAVPTHPAAVVEEFVDCYRIDPTDAAEVDNRYALPDALREGLIERGEEKLYENAALAFGGQPAMASIARPSIEEVSERSRDRIVLPRVAKGGGVVKRPCFSASQIESYLECPQKWFALRRLRLDELEEGFGAVEMGDFSHGVLEAFYRRFQEEVAPKVTADTLVQARSIMSEVFSERLREQPARRPSSNRLVAVTELEKRQVDELSARLSDYLGREAELLAEFRPAYLEYEIPASEAVDYAGYGLMGTIDRIDIDDEGRAIIIDYKSSLSREYDLYDSEGELRLGKVQALIYAQAVRRRLGLEVVGALYVGYGRSPKVSGALDYRIEPSHVPGLKEATCVYREGPLSDMLDATEARVAEALARLLEGHVEAKPSADGVCSWCPEISCAKRRG